MWDRVELKSLAKASLKNNYWNAFLVSLVLMLVTGRGGSSRGEDTGEYLARHPEYYMIFLVVVTLLLVFRILVGYSLEVGSRRYFVKLSQYKNTKGCYGFSFDSMNYKGIVSTMFLMNVYNILWTLLFVIPGIIKAYSYRMVPYILGDNPNIGANEAITLSRKMMDGNKFEAFVLDISFLGWYLLGLLALVIGMLFVNPYYDATCAQLYVALRKISLDNGTATSGDFNLNDFNAQDEYNDYDRYYRD
ncbi:DUF975 family protein [Sedimentibacter saalensis]|uniref:DUF975 family protein n=1 Tax=Sedimentibacter saalensis TaxID=130788 RepID=UPI00289B2BB6|nr:DUF975 family protein [Sedimentibacter saalensis]